jgi:glucose-6-phosphate isomerase
MTALTASPAWRALRAHAEAVRGVHLRELFARDPRRFERFSLGLDDLLLDYSKNRVTEETMRLLLDLARSANVEGWRARMFAGERINATEAGPSCTWPCATARTGRSRSTAPT